MPKNWIHAKNKIFVPSLFMTFLDVIEVPEHDKAIKYLVSVYMSVCLPVCVSVITINLLFHYTTELAMVPKSLYFDAMSFWDFTLDSIVTCVTKTSLFQAIFEIFSFFLIFLWIVEHIIIVADVNAHLVMYHMYRVCAPITWRAWQKR
jgi:hypothetical protein